ncbi:NYN domain-containing protein [Chloroflexus sp.]|uniref:NYN domain-containing protein n=1 Tax=Chloroflexus sp. TaxID=1904827 RepID=UPI002ADE7B31|nr:NYN domain-containing protein [Chloroflexus sp.]
MGRIVQQIQLPRIALLIDGENCPAAQAKVVLKIARRQGDLIVKRVYANWSQPANQAWIEPVARYGLQPVHHERVATNKNATDILLVVEAMDLLHGGQIDQFCLVTGDSDYVPLVKRLRKAGKEVIVISSKHAAEALRDACNQFISLEEVQYNPGFAPPSPSPVSGVTNTAGDTAGPDSMPAHTSSNQSQAEVNTHPDVTSAAISNEQVTPDRTPTTNPLLGTRETTPFTNGVTRPLREAVELLAEAIKRTTKCDSEGWVSVAIVGQEIRKLDPTFHPNRFGHASLSKLVLAIGRSVQMFETRSQSISRRNGEVEVHSNQLEVRLRPKSASTASSEVQARLKDGNVRDTGNVLCCSCRSFFVEDA